MSDEALSTVEDYVKDVRVLLLDRIEPYRYKTPEIITAFNLALLEGRRLRADLFAGKERMHVPSYTADSTEEVPIEGQFRLAFVYGTAAHTLLRDDEDVQDERANSFMAAFYNMLCGERPRPIAGGTPGPKSAQQ